MRVCFIVSYDGSRFDGSQQQPHKNTILGSFIKVCEKLSINSKPVASGRTDKNVHANNQAIHLDLPFFWHNLKKLQATFNKHLHPFIHVKRIFEVDGDFHARFSAKKRVYRYIISHEKFCPIKSFYVCHYPKIDHENIEEILRLFEGRHDFAMFRKSGSPMKSTIREIFTTKLYMYKNHTIITLCANGFLRSQIRMIVSVLLKANEGKLRKEHILEQLHCQKQHSFTLAPASGLYLHKIYYK